MKIALCIKQVPDTSDIKWTEHNTIRREGVESIINPYDVYAIEAALHIKNIIKNTEITAMTMGPLQAEEMLRKTIALGVDKAALISDRKFAGADTYATGKTLAQSIKTIVPDFDIVICGQFAIDGDTAQTGPSIANHLNLPQVTFVKELVEVTENYIVVRRQADDGIETVKCELPALICMLQDTTEPSRAKINGYIKAQNTEIKTFTIDDIGLAPEDAGLKGSPTYVSKAFRPIVTHTCEKIYADENTAKLVLEKINEFKAGVNE